MHDGFFNKINWRDKNTNVNVRDKNYNENFLFTMKDLCRSEQIAIQYILCQPYS